GGAPLGGGGGRAPGAADRRGGPGAAWEKFVPPPADQNVVGDAAGGVERDVAAATEEQRGYGNAVKQLDGVVPAVAVDEQVGESRAAGGGEASDGVAADGERDSVAGPRAEHEIVGVGGALDDQGALGGVAEVSLDRRGHGENGYRLRGQVTDVVLRPDVHGCGHPDVVRADVRVAVIDRGAVGAADGLVHDTIAVPVDGVSEDGGGGQSAAGAEAK